MRLYREDKATEEMLKLEQNSCFPLLIIKKNIFLQGYNNLQHQQLFFGNVEGEENSTFFFFFPKLTAIWGKEEL